MLRIGKIVATHGVEGGVVLKHILPDADWVKVGMALFISLRKDSFIPHFVAHLKVKSPEEVLLQFEEITSPEAAQMIRGKEVFAEENHIRTHSLHSPLAWIGFDVTDQQYGPLGKLEDVYQSGPQWLGQVTVDGKEVLMPLIAEFILKIDIDQQSMHTKMPAGLLEIYTDN